MRAIIILAMAASMLAACQPVIKQQKTTGSTVVYADPNIYIAYGEFDTAARGHVIERMYTAGSNYKAMLKDTTIRPEHCGIIDFALNKNYDYEFIIPNTRDTFHISGITYAEPAAGKHTRADDTLYRTVQHISYTRNGKDTRLKYEELNDREGYIQLYTRK
jgi:hypothetical protein